MKSLREIFSRPASLREIPAGCPTEQEPNGSGKGANYGNHGVHIGRNNIGGSLTVSAWHRGIELRANTLSQLTMELQRYDRKADAFVTDNITPNSRHLNYLMSVRPNPLMSWPILVRQAEENRILHGNAVLYIHRDIGGEIDSLWLCDFVSYNVVNNTYNICYYSLSGYVTLSNVQAADVIHVRNTFTDYNGLVGIPTLMFASRSLSIAATNDAETLSNAGKGGKLKLLVQEEKSQNFGLGRVSKQQLQKITDELNEKIYEQDVVLLSNVAGVTPISQNAQQMELLESRKFSVPDIARFLSVPKSLLMDDSGSSYKSPEAATAELLSRTLAPMICEWEAEFAEKLIGEQGFGYQRCHMCELPLLRLDLKGQAEIDKLNLEMGVKSPNELRKQQNLPKIADGDKHYIRMNLGVVGSERLEKGGQA